MPVLTTLRATTWHVISQGGLLCLHEVHGTLLPLCPVYVPGVGALRALSCAEIEGQGLHFLHTRAGTLQVNSLTPRQHRLHVIPLFKGYLFLSRTMVYPYPSFSSGTAHASGVYFSCCCFLLDALFPMDSVAVGARSVKHNSEDTNTKMKCNTLWAK